MQVAAPSWCLTLLLKEWLKQLICYQNSQFIFQSNSQLIVVPCHCLKIASVVGCERPPWSLCCSQLPPDQWLWIHFQSVLSLLLVCTASGCNLLPWRQKHELVDSQRKITEAFISDTWGEDYEMQFKANLLFPLNFHTQYFCWFPQ